MNNTAPLTIGARYYNSSLTGYFTGLIDDIRMYNRALSYIEIQQLYHEGGYPTLIEGGVVNDNDGNCYSTVKIGNQVWMAENLKTTKYANGEGISSGIYVPGDDVNNIAIYGRLYSWYVATDSRNVCPTDWHVPSGADE